MDYIEEIKESVNRYFQYVWDWDEEDIKNLKIIPPKEDPVIEDGKKNTLSLPLTLIVGKEPDFRLKRTYEDSENYLEEITKWKFLYELFRERIGYVGAPFKPELMWLPKEENGYSLDLSAIDAVRSEVCKLIDDKSTIKTRFNNLKNFIKIAGKYFTTEDLTEKGAIEHETDNDVRLLHQLANLVAGCVIKEKRQEIKKNVLLIDNNPERELVKIDTRFKGILKGRLQDIMESFSNLLHIFYYKKGFEDLYLKLSKAKEEEDLIIEVEGQSGSKIKKNVKDFDFILVDIFLGEKVPNGIEFIKLLTTKFPSIPSFALSVSDDFSTMREAIKEGADYYILKNQIFSLLYVYYSYIGELGRILDYLTEGEYKKNLLGNIRYWIFKKNLLWFGDKCYHMIDHSYKHTFDDWKYMNQVLISLIKEKRKEKILGDGDDLLYAFCMAVWLHDIGHKGTDVHGEPHLIRDNHGYISGELILRYPEFFRIKDPDKYYNHNKIDFSRVSAAELIYNRDKEDSSITEMIALISMYHKSNTPIDWTECKNLLGKKKTIPLEYYVGKEKKDGNILTLEKILDKRLKIKELREEYEKFKDEEIESQLYENSDSKNKRLEKNRDDLQKYVAEIIKERLEKKKELKNKLLHLVALFRFIDSIDIRNIRVGDITEKELKEAVIKNDAEYQLKKLEKEIKALSRQYTKTPIESALFVKSFYQDIVEKIKTGEFTQLNLPKELIENSEELENYEVLTDYAAYVAFQPTHFSLHSSVKDIKFNYKGNGRLDITLLTDKDEKKLKKEKVRERGKKEQSVYERLIGEECYVFKELEGAKHYLRDFFSKVRLRLMNGNGTIYDERVWPET